MARYVILIVPICLLSACTSAPVVESTPESSPTFLISPSATESPQPSLTSTPQPRLSPVTYGPELENFPPGINPLTGQEVQDPSLLDLPAVLVSISNMPITARPQAGPSFASWVYELYIGEGTTRFVGVFYGDIPRIIPNVLAGCKLREGIVRPESDWIGNRVWLDENENGIQDTWEAGVGGVCVRLLDSRSRKVLDETATNSNGYYAFDLPKSEAIVQFVAPDVYRFTTSNRADEDRDSDADPATGETSILQADSTVSFWDAGLILSGEPLPTPSPVVTGTPPNWFIPFEPYVGPVRSGRLTYNHIGGMFPNSCLAYAGAASDIGERLDACEIVYGVDKTTPNSALLTVTRLRELAEGNLNPRQPVNYSGNLFSDTPPDGGQPAESMQVFYHSHSQSGWQYDPVSETYLRFTDQADGNGTLIPATDRLTDRQMAFENVIVVFAEHNRFRHNQLEVDFRFGQKKPAYLFRNGKAFQIHWSTANREWEKTTGLLRPMHFVDAQDNLIPLHPGRTWIHIVTPYSMVTEEANAEWLIRFVQPPDPTDTPIPSETPIPTETPTPSATPTP
jgi:hypothetical protein